MKFFDLILVARDLVLQFLELVLQGLNRADLLLAFLLSSSHIFVEQITLSLLLLNLFPILVDHFLLGLVQFGDELELLLDLLLFAIVLLFPLLSLLDFPGVDLENLLIVSHLHFEVFNLGDDSLKLDVFLILLVELILLGSFISLS